VKPTCQPRAPPNGNPLHTHVGHQIAPVGAQVFAAQGLHAELIERAGRQAGDQHAARIGEGARRDPRAAADAILHQIGMRVGHRIDAQLQLRGGLVENGFDDRFARRDGGVMAGRGEIEMKQRDDVHIALGLAFQPGGDLAQQAQHRLAGGIAGEGGRRTALFQRVDLGAEILVGRVQGRRGHGAACGLRRIGHQGVMHRLAAGQQRRVFKLRIVVRYMVHNFVYSGWGLAVPRQTFLVPPILV